MPISYSVNFNSNAPFNFIFPDDVTLIIASGTWGPAQLDIRLWDGQLADYQTIDSWVEAAPVPKRSEVKVPRGSRGQLLVSGASGTNLNVTIKRGSVV